MTSPCRILAVFVLSLLVPVCQETAASAIQDTAAETDWVKSATPGQCKGRYAESATVATDKIKASADSATHLQDHSTTFVGNISIRHKSQELKADFVTIDAATEIYSAEGNVSLRQPGLLMKGEKITGNLFNNTAAIDSASFLLHKNRVRGTATSIAKDSEESLVIKDGSFTTCEPGSETWVVEGESIELNTADGYGIARDVTLRVSNMPVAYLPWFRFPIDDRRQSGLLMPSAGQDSDGGTDIAIPYYFNLRPNLDATYTLRNIHRRGLAHEAETRYLNRHSENLLALAYLPSDDIFDDREVVTPGQDFSRQDRWLAHLAHRGRFGNWSSRINFTSVSDIDYFHDLGSFSSTRTHFDRALGQSDNPAILRSGSIRYDRANWGTSLELRSFQQLNQTRAEQYQVLPRLALYGSRNLSAFQLSGEMQLTEFERRDTAPEGSRAVFDGSISLPLQRAWGYLVPKVRTVHRDYELRNVQPTIDDSISVTTTLASIDMGLVFERRGSFLGTGAKQTLEPRLFYLHADEDFQATLPSFDSSPLTPTFDSLFRDNRYTGYDRIGDADQVSLGLTTRYYNASGAQLFAASLGQTYHFSDRKVNFGLTPGVDPTADTSPVFLAINTKVGDLDIRSAYEYDSDSGKSNRSYVSLKYRHPSSALVNFTYTLTDVSVQRDRLPRNEEETDLSFLWPISENINVIGRWNYGWDNKETTESLLGVEYNDCCWKARIVFRRELEEPRLIGLAVPGQPIQYVTDRRADSGIYFEFQLKGLASLGGRLDSLIRDSIPGYIASR